MSLPHSPPDVGCQNPGLDGKLGTDYVGTASSTDGGLLCQRWSSTFPHKHDRTKMGDHNFCRNTPGSSDPRVWCYTAESSKRWDFCTVPKCDTNGKDSMPF